MLLWDRKEFAMVREWVLVLYGTMTTPQRNDSLALQTAVNKRGEVKLNKKTKNQNPEVFIKQRKNGKDKKFSNVKLTTFIPTAHSTIAETREEFTRIQKFKKINTNSYQPVTTTARPRVTVKLPTLKSHNENVNNLYSRKKLKEGSSYQTDNKSAVKQVTSSMLSTESTVIPKKFGKYEKIEQFYPEFRPVNEYNNPAFFTVTTKSKTDNDSLKSTSMMPTNVHSKSMSGVENESIAVQRARQQQNKTPKGREEHNTILCRL